jgi:glutamine synthetase
MSKIIIEYVWIGGNMELRSKIKVLLPSDVNLNSTEEHLNLRDVPHWNFDGSSTSQSSGTHSELRLFPVALYKNPLIYISHNSHSKAYAVLCETTYNDYKQTKSNNRYKTFSFFNSEKVQKLESWFGFEQEYFIMNDDIKKLLHKNINECVHNISKFYCSVGSRYNFFRNIAESHMTACIDAGIQICGINSEVSPCQWEFQIGPGLNLKAADDLWMARYFLEKIAQNFNSYIIWHPKPFKLLNGSGLHSNFSTKFMRNPNGLQHIINSIDKLKTTHSNDILCFGEHNEKRMSGLYETSHFDSFHFNIDTPTDRGASVRIGYDTIKNKKGYFEDRRPASNADPYIISKLLVLSCL